MASSRQSAVQFLELLDSFAEAFHLRQAPLNVTVGSGVGRQVSAPNILELQETKPTRRAHA